MADLAANAYAEDGERLGRQDDLGTQRRINTDLFNSLFRGIPVEPVEVRLVTIVVDIDQDAEGDEKKAENKTDNKPCRKKVIQEFILGDMENHSWFYLYRRTPRPSVTS